MEVERWRCKVAATGIHTNWFGSNNSIRSRHYENGKLLLYRQWCLWPSISSGCCSYNLPDLTTADDVKGNKSNTSGGFTNYLQPQMSQA
ncbi:unnamed protein product [Urochloa humidicola]